MPRGQRLREEGERRNRFQGQGSAITQRARKTGPEAAAALIRQTGVTDYFSRVREQGFFNAATPSVAPLLGAVLDQAGVGVDVLSQRSDDPDVVAQLEERFGGIRKSPVGQFLAGPVPEDVKPKTDGSKPDRTSGGDVEGTLDKVDQAQVALEHTERILEGELTPESRLQAEAIREQLVKQLEVGAQTLNQFQHAQIVQDAIFEFQARQLGLDPDVGDLALAGLEGGVADETANAIMSALADDSLTNAEKQDTIDLLNDRFKFGGEITREIESLVKNERDLRAMIAMPDAELLNDEVQYMQPRFINSIEFDPTVRFQNNAQEEFDRIFPNFDATGNPQAKKQWNDSMSQALNGTLTINSPAIGLLSFIMNESKESLVEAFDSSIARANASEEALLTSVDAPILKPGSEELMYAAQTAAMEDGWPPAAAQLLANSMALHAIIEQKSNGRAGAAGEGTIRGIGGLTEDTYQLLMGEEWNKTRGMQWELTALIRWIEFGFDGRITDAINYYHRTGDWGGTGALPDGGKSIRDTVGAPVSDPFDQVGAENLDETGTGF